MRQPYLVLLALTQYGLTVNVQLTDEVRTRPVCMGALPEFALPSYIQDERLHRFPYVMTLQEICSVDEQLSVAQSWGPSIGFFCTTKMLGRQSNNDDDNEILEPFFDAKLLFLRADLGRLDGRYANPRLELFCRLRCLCPWENFLKKDPRFNFHYAQELEYSLEIEEHYNPDSEPAQVHTQRNAALYVQRFIGNNPSVIGTMDISQTAIKLDPRSDIVCDNAEVEYALWPEVSAFWSWSDMQSNTALCANMWVGGSNIASAGGVCAGSAMNRHVDFYDEFVPNPEFRIQENWHIASGVRLYCLRQCRCAFDGDGDPDNWVDWSLFNGGQADFSEDGVQFQVDDIHGAASVTIPLIPPPASGSHECQDRRRYCGKEWPVHLLGPKPWKEDSTLPSQLEMTKSLVQNNYKSDPMCGAQCRHRSECPGANIVDGCQCRARKIMHGTGKAAFISFCWVLQSNVHHRSGLHPRTEEVLAGCVCNETYVSQACCSSQGGLVWEPPDRRLGSLLEEL